MTTMSSNDNVAKNEPSGKEHGYNTSWRAVVFTALTVIAMLVGIVLIFMYGLPYA